MGILDRFKQEKSQGGGTGTPLMDRAREMLHSHSGQVDEGVDKAGRMIDDRTGHKYAGQIHTGVKKAKDMLAKQGERVSHKTGEPGAGTAAGTGTGAGTAAGSEFGAEMPQSGTGGMPPVGEETRPPQS